MYILILNYRKSQMITRWLLNTAHCVLNVPYIASMTPWNKTTTLALYRMGKRA